MARYLETVDKLQKEVNSFMFALADHVPDSQLEQAAVQLGHIVNLAVRCNPRQSQGTVRKNIVAGAMATYCHVTMTKEEDAETGRSYNKIHITAKG